MLDETLITMVQNALKALREGNVHATLELLQSFSDRVPHEDPVKAASQTLIGDYEDDVQTVVNDLVESWRKGEYDGDRDSFITAIDESVEGTQRVIYTFQAQLGIACSNNSDAYLEDMDGNSIPCENGIPWSTLMFCAMKKDVLDGLAREDVDVNADPPLEGSSKCEKCDEYKVCKEGVCEDCTP